MRAAAIYKRFETSLLPPERRIVFHAEGSMNKSELSTLRKIPYYVTNLFIGLGSFSLCVAAVIITLAFRSIIYLATRHKPAKKDPLQIEAVEESTILAILRKYLPDMRGYSTSVFQDALVGTEHSAVKLKGTSNWAKNMDPKHVKFKDKPDFTAFGVNYLDNPKRFVEILKEQNITSFRLSLERCVIEHEQNSEANPDLFNAEAIAKYHSLFQELNAARIIPLVTLHHFVDPQWFEDIGRFEKEENIDTFVRYALAMIEEFTEIDHWMTFNEPAVYVFQTYVTKVYPGKGHESIFHAAKVLRNLLLSHVKTYLAIKEKHPEKQVGITHQWLKFTPSNPDNPVESLACNYLSQLTHQSTIDFFIRQEDGKFRFILRLPGICDEYLEVEADKIIDYMGVQHYGFPDLMIGVNQGESYPGKVVNLLTSKRLKTGMTMGATCKKGGRVANFGPPFSPETLIDALLEALKTKQPVIITETGFDQYVQHFGSEEVLLDEKTQKQAFAAICTIASLFRCQDLQERNLLERYLWQQLDDQTQETWDKIQSLRNLTEEQTRLIGLQVWTFLSRQMEWDNADRVRLGAAKDTVVDPITKEIQNIVHSEGSAFLQKVFARA